MPHIQTAARLSDNRVAVRAVVPPLKQHTPAVLAGLGCSAREIAAPACQSVI